MKSLFSKYFCSSLNRSVYINHRPAFGLHPDQLVDAFEKIGLIGEEGDIEIPRSELLAILQDKGLFLLFIVP